MSTLLIIPGAQKSGTGSLVQLLRQHADIQPGQIKEPQFFAMQPPVVAQWARWYRQEFFPASDCRYQIDGSTMYLHSAEAPSLIAAQDPEARIVITLRDPASRTYSSWQHLHKKISRPDQRSYTQVLREVSSEAAALGIWDSEQAAIDAAIKAGCIDTGYLGADYGLDKWPRPFAADFQDPLQLFRYFGLSQYRIGVERFEAAFPGRVKVIYFEQREVTDFLQVDWPAAWDGEGLLGHRNETRTPKSPWVHAAFTAGKRLGITSNRIRALKPLSNFLRQKLWEKPAKVSQELRAETQELLMDEYRYWHARDSRLTELWPVLPR